VGEKRREYWAWWLKKGRKLKGGKNSGRGFKKPKKKGRTTLGSLRGRDEVRGPKKRKDFREEKRGFQKWVVGVLLALLNLVFKGLQGEMS